MNDKLTIVHRKTFLDLCAAASAARTWMATQAPATDWANQVRQDLHNAHSRGVSEESLSPVEILELAAQAESLLNLYMEAKRELHAAVGTPAMDVAKFPIVLTVRAQIRVVRDILGRVA